MVGMREGSHITQTFVSLRFCFALICGTALMRLLLSHDGHHQGAIVGADVAFQVDDLLPRAQHE